MSGRWKPPHPARTVTKCCWPKCPRSAHNDLPLCWAHLRIARDLWEKYSTDPEAAKIGFRVEVGAPAPETETPPPVEGTIYYLRSGGYFKIGWTADLDKRMKGYPPDTALLATQPGTKRDERALHRRFSHLISRGREWFVLAPEIEDHIATVVGEYGPPPAVDFTAKRTTRTPGRQTQYVGGPNRGNLPARTVRG